ncbi:hypothetical protein FRC02_008465 [Tulasnella sp. 418]|nr:hypothetical protein FRC02_008465 [Tulasnella sp. 418]
MLLEEDNQIPPSSIRTIRLSSRSFLNATLSEDSIPLYSFTTQRSLSSFKRHDRNKDGSSAEGTTEIAVIHWSEMESSETSSIESSTARKNRILPKHFLSASSAKDDNVLIDMNGRRWQLTELLKSQPLGGSRKFIVDGKSFKWKHLAGLWQCFFSSNLIAVFEPSILTAAARLRIIPCPDLLSITRRVLDNLVLTCMLLATHPTEWRKPTQKRQPRLARSVSMGFSGATARSQNPRCLTQQGSTSANNSTSTLPSIRVNGRTRYSSMSLDMRRSYSNPSSNRANVITPFRYPEQTSRSSSLPVSWRSTSSETTTPNTQTGPRSARPLPPVPLTITPSSPLTPPTSVRRLSQQSSNGSPTSYTAPSTSSNTQSSSSGALKILSRSTPSTGTPSGSTALSGTMTIRNLRRALSQYHLLPPPPEEITIGSMARSSSFDLDRSSITGDLSSLVPTTFESAIPDTIPDGPQDDGGNGLGTIPGPLHSPRPWELPSAYPVPYCSSTHEQEENISPPPYTPRG